MRRRTFLLGAATAPPRARRAITVRAWSRPRRTCATPACRPATRCAMARRCRRRPAPGAARWRSWGPAWPACRAPGSWRAKASPISSWSKAPSTAATPPPATATGWTTRSARTTCRCRRCSPPTCARCWPTSASPSATPLARGPTTTSPSWRTRRRNACCATAVGKTVSCRCTGCPRPISSSTASSWRWWTACTARSATTAARSSASRSCCPRATRRGAPWMR